MREHIVGAQSVVGSGSHARDRNAFFDGPACPQRSKLDALLRVLRTALKVHADHHFAADGGRKFCECVAMSSGVNAGERTLAFELHDVQPHDVPGRLKSLSLFGSWVRGPRETVRPPGVSLEEMQKGELVGAPGERATRRSKACEAREGGAKWRLKAI
ncbi:MAG: hypothetical protein HY791_10085 [Deltaproteobacteria bacterium]|nr:hypothetical protein [Deltaproteobacteria bacterium]